MTKTNHKTLFTLFILTIMLTATASVATPKAHASGTIYVTPASINDPSIAPGATISVNASGSNIVDLFTWQVQLEYNPAILNCTGVTIPTGSIFKFDVPVSPIIDNSAGKAVIGSTKITGSGASGSGVFATFTFKVLARGYSSINYSRPLGTDTFLLDSLQHDIPVDVQDGSFNNYIPPAAATIAVNPPKVIDPTLIAGQTFDVNLTIADATNVQSWAANIYYSNSILNAANALEGQFLASAGGTTFSFTVDNAFNATHGKLALSCSLSTGGASGNGVLATITFDVTGLGQSDITVADLSLSDPSMISLPFTTSNGYFNNMLIGVVAVDPPEIIGPTYLPGTTFKINVTIAGFDGLKTILFNLTYDPTILQELNVNFMIVQGQIPVKTVQLDDSRGYIWVNLTYPHGLSTLDPLPVMNVEFVVLSMGVSPLHFSDVQLFDLSNSLIEPTAYEVHDGIFIGLIRDVAVLSIIPDLTDVYQNWTVNVQVTVKNKGNVTETFDAHLFFDAYAGPTYTVVNLIPNEERNVTIPWSTVGVPWYHNYSLSVTVGPVPYETNLSDNNLTQGYVKVRIPGDVNDDGVVDMRDINEVCVAFGSYPGGPKWNFYADFNRDGRIDLRDIGLACAFFGTRG